MERASIHIMRVPANTSPSFKEQHDEDTHIADCTICKQSQAPSVLIATLSCCHSSSHVACLTPWITGFLYPRPAISSTSSSNSAPQLRFRYPSSSEYTYQYPPCPACRAPFDVAAYFDAISSIATGTLVLEPQQESQDGNDHEKGEIQRVKRIEVVVRVQEGQALEFPTQTLLRRGLRTKNEALYDQIVNEDPWSEELSGRWGHDDEQEDPWDEPINFDSHYGQGQRLGTDPPTTTDQDPVVGDSTHRGAEGYTDSQTISRDHNTSNPVVNAQLLEKLRSSTHPSTADESRPPPPLTSHHGHGNRLVPLPTDLPDLPVPDEVLAAQHPPHHQEEAVQPPELYSHEHGPGQRLGGDDDNAEGNEGQGIAGRVHGGGVVTAGQGRGGGNGN